MSDCLKATGTNFESYQGSAREEKSAEEDLTASHLKRLVANTSCRTALRKKSLKGEEKLLEAAQKRKSLKKYRRGLLDYRFR
ncbi:unnamed protein product [Strongylus vulgaris]|uniref:Uncharacterized protein n=1 Tax=Strongylus vulgaris TaxID=40348 RepID=A0A3P7I122_STRVU|nr:unnamed protein product [Strongylus vulgaris]